MSGSSSATANSNTEQDQSIRRSVGERTFSEELQLSLEELATSLVELYQTLSPLVQEAQELTVAVDSHTQFMSAWVDFTKSGAQSLQKQREEESQPMDTQSE